MKVCVTGAPCGGSSAIANILNLMGVSLERHAFSELDAELLLHLGGTWDQPPVLDPGWEREPRLDPFRSRASGLVAEVVGWEDPQVALLLPFWQTVTPIDTTIVVVRDPAEIARSLRARYAIDPPQAALLWLRYLLSATGNDPGHLLIRYDELVTDPMAVLAAIACHLDLPAPDTVLEESVREPLHPRHDGELAPTVVPSGDGNPLVALAAAVWNDGEIDLAAVPPVVADGITQGRLRPPVDGELLARARAQVMKLRERVRRQHRHEAALEYTISDGGTR